MRKLTSLGTLNLLGLTGCSVEEKHDVFIGDSDYDSDGVLYQTDRLPGGHILCSDLGTFAMPPELTQPVKPGGGEIDCDDPVDGES